MKKLFLLLALGQLLSSAVYAKLNVVATTPDFGAIARAIGDDKIDITILARATEDPHFVDAKPSYIVKLSRADALLEGGAELEIGWLPPLLEGARNSKLAPGAPGYIACNQGVQLLEVPTTLDRSKRGYSCGRQSPLYGGSGERQDRRPTYCELLFPDRS